MRRHLLLLAAFLLMAQVHAQDIKVGLKGGYNRVSIHRVAQVNTLRPLEPLTPRHGYHVGLTTHIGLSEFFGIHVEPTFIRKGVLRGTMQEESLSYLEIPLLLSVNPWKQLKIEAGPAAGFLLAANIENGSDVRPKPVTNRREVSRIVGASWDFDDRLNF
ncbi:MAG: outer membrane beta-barrel protein, partial [Bacteroidota bacterium]